MRKATLSFSADRMQPVSDLGIRELRMGNWDRKLKLSSEIPFLRSGTEFRETEFRRRGVPVVRRNDVQHGSQNQRNRPVACTSFADDVQEKRRK
jgi:hypothetical protein